MRVQSELTAWRAILEGVYRAHPFFGILFLILLVAVVALGVVLVVREWGRGRPSQASGTPQAQPFDPALAELRMRYARGEISWEEYAQRASGLGYPMPPPVPQPPVTHAEAEQPSSR